MLQICPPYLHILLGIVKKHHDLMELECHNLDELVAVDVALHTEEINDTLYHRYLKQVKEMHVLKEKLEYLDADLENLEDTVGVADYESEEIRLKEEREDLVSNNHL